MQAANLSQPPVSPGDDSDSDKTPNRSNSTSTGVSIAYAGGGGRQPILHNISTLFHSGIQSLGAMAESLFGPDNGGSSSGGEGNNDNNNGKDRKISCYCLPCLSVGRGEQGRSNVRVITTLFFPIFLLSFFLLDDFGHVIMRNVRLRHTISKGLLQHSSSMKKDMGHPVLRRKTIHEFRAIKREIMWVPLENTVNIDEETSVVVKTKKCPRGVLFLFHGCGRFAASFFYSPQGRRMVSMAYNEGITVVAFEKKNERGCWDWNEDGEEVLKVGRKFVLSRLEADCGHDANGDVIYPPMWAFGASSGGSFVAMLASQMKEAPEKYAPFHFSAINVQIMSPSESLDWDIPTMFTVMDGDAQTKERVQERVATKFQGGPFRMITTSGQKAIHADHFAKVFPDDKQMSAAVSSNIYQDLVNMGIVDSSNNNMLAMDPRQSEDAVTSIWEKYDVELRAVEAGVPKEEVLPFGVSQQMKRPLRADEVYDANNIWLIEELNVAWDQHEITSEGFGDVLDFFFEFGVPR
ncbi:hypothetical protein ACHAXR_013114 [Thalassiosira sp. AJA248-18]